ncbi:hypothetical protein TWF730_006087 [Orbilia blumenaviensis]|uniref:Uncharacterized protein n=1 Tax=Orbilia blumenaviensis TaxID=1796055 RepID=A0AAV9TXW9_9PEZI
MRQPTPVDVVNVSVLIVIPGQAYASNIDKLLRHQLEDRTALIRRKRGPRGAGLICTDRSLMKTYTSPFTHRQIDRDYPIPPPVCTSRTLRGCYGSADSPPALNVSRSPQEADANIRIGRPPCSAAWLDRQFVSTCLDRAADSLSVEVLVARGGSSYNAIYRHSKEGNAELGEEPWSLDCVRVHDVGI